MQYCQLLIQVHLNSTKLINLFRIFNGNQHFGFRHFTGVSIQMKTKDVGLGDWLNVNDDTGKY